VLGLELDCCVAKIIEHFIFSMILLDNLLGCFAALAAITTDFQAATDVAQVAGAVIQFFNDL